MTRASSARPRQDPRPPPTRSCSLGGETGAHDNESPSGYQRDFADIAARQKISWSEPAEAACLIGAFDVAQHAEGLGLRRVDKTIQSEEQALEYGLINQRTIHKTAGMSAIELSPMALRPWLYLC
jgi:hypothetical protein